MELSSKPYQQVCFGPFEVDLRSGKLQKKGRRVKLQQQPFQILAILLDRPGELVTREELVRRLWPANVFVDYDHSLNKAVNKLRDVLGDSSQEPRYIETQARRGYRFIAPLREGVGPQPGDKAAQARPAFQSSTPVQPEIRRAVLVGETEQRGGKKIFTALTVAAGVLIAISIARYGFSRHGAGGKTEELQLTRLTDSRKTERVAISPDGRYVVYAAEEGSGLGLWIRQVLTRSGDVEIVPPEVGDVAGLTFSPDGNFVYFVRGNKNSSNSTLHSLFVTPVLGGPTRLLLRGIGSPVSFSPDGHQFVFTHLGLNQDALELRTADADGSAGRLLAILQDAAPFHQAGPAWSPDGRTIAVSVMFRGKSPGWALEAVSVTDGTVHEIYSSPFKVGRPLWLPTGDGLLVALDDQNNHGQLYLMPFPRGKPRRLTNDLTDYDDDRIDLTRDGKTAAIVAWDESGNVWQAPAADLTKAWQSESSGAALLTIAARPDRKILATDSDNKLWIMNPDGSQRALFTDVHPASAPLVCGQFVLFFQETVQADPHGLVRADADGANVRKLVDGPVGSAACSPGGKFVFYDTQDSRQKIRKIPVEGGVPVDVATIPSDRIERQLVLSPGGTLLAYLYRESIDSTAAVEKLAVIPADGGPPVKVFNVPWGISTLRWSPDGKALQYVVCVFCAGTPTNIWEQPLNGGEPRRLTNFSFGRIFDFDWSADGKSLLLIRGDLNGDVVLLSSFR